MLPPASQTPRGDRRTQRSDLTSTWSVYHPEKAGTPIRKSQLEALEDEPVGAFLDRHGVIQRGGKPREHEVLALDAKTGDESADALLLVNATKTFRR